MSTNVAASPSGEPLNSARPVNVMLTAPILPTLARLSLPNMMAMVAMALVTIAETAYVGALGTPQLAGLTLVFPLVMAAALIDAGFQEVHPAFAAAGDVGITADGVLCVRMPAGFIARSEAGYGTVRPVKAWAIGSTE